MLNGNNKKYLSFTNLKYKLDKMFLQVIPIKLQAIPNILFLKIDGI